MENEDNYSPDVTARIAKTYAALGCLAWDSEHLPDVYYKEDMDRRRSRARECIETIPKNVAEFLEPKPKVFLDTILENIGDGS